ncbi:hypothetical protein FA10DRAFT_298656 [Acaromyces ingoldii]|uniref:Histone chaperone domain-containing protein n=1 Tax=Acaromyces ingoldii TaxID=215250 RepID=A0A316YX71_9BASI|nr:hypothetical protein FA10DRAFT_298656 [Acaromyces ingoldii]PWN93248.1 hypothetical protein FA10DRAFT_298656 [Acaromyces ingoldii]
MTFPTDAELTAYLTKKIHKASDLASLSRRVLKDSVVERYGLGTEEKRRLEEDERIKQLVKDVITRAVKERESLEDAGRANEATQEKRIKGDRPKPKKASKVKEVEEEEMNDDDDEQQAQHLSDFSSMEDSDEGPAPKKKARKSSSPSSRKKSASVTPAGKESDKVKRLKSYIFLAGLRKPYKKIFADANCSDPPPSSSASEEAKVYKKQISILQGILQEELGIEGRPTKEKCKIARDKREWEKEMEEIQRAGKTERARTRGGARKSLADVGEGSENEKDEGDEERGEEEPASKPPKFNRFLADFAASLNDD